jgi:hypothetical protein
LNVAFLVFREARHTKDRLCEARRVTLCASVQRARTFLRSFEQTEQGIDELNRLLDKLGPA